MIMEYRCSCYFWRHLYVKRLGLHVDYKNREHFVSNYGSVLTSRDCGEKANVEDIIAEIEAEVARRRSYDKNYLERCRAISKEFQRKQPSVYTLSEDYFAPKFKEIFSYCKQPGANRNELLSMIKTECPGVYSFPFFTEEFCEQFTAELDHIEESSVPKGRPNSMNNYGILLEEFGFNESFTIPLRTQYLMPLAQLLFPVWVDDGLDSHKAFIVRYATGEDLDLSYHFDNAEVTLNVNLGKQFTGGNLYFGKMKNEETREEDLVEYKHARGQAVLHRGYHMHGARPLLDGCRYNLIIWMRSSSVRNDQCPMCNSKPVLVQCSCPGDGFTKPVNHYSCQFF